MQHFSDPLARLKRGVKASLKPSLRHGIFGDFE